MRSLSLVAPILAASALLSMNTWAAAPNEPPAPRSTPLADKAGLSFIAGAGSAMVPIIFGAALASSGTDNPQKNVGLAIIGAGFAVAPLVSHAVLGEFRRAAFFTALPVASEIGFVSLIAAQGDAVFRVTKLSRATAGVLFSAGMVSSLIGLIDAAIADDRARGQRFILAPSVARDQIGLTLVGAL